MKKTYTPVKKLILLFFSFVMVCGLIAIYAVKIEPYTFVTHNYSLKAPSTAFSKNLRIVQISDIQISKTYNLEQLKKLVNKVNQTHPDILIFTGDLYENYSEYGPYKSVIDILQRLEAPYGKFAIWGNRDYGGGAAKTYDRVMKKSGFTVLKNSHTLITLKDGSRVLIAGLDDALLGKPNVSKTSSCLDTESDYKILLLHEPDIADDFKDSSFDLILAGHSHGGQIYFPFVKGFTTALGEKYQRGFYHLNQQFALKKPVLYVNTGIGTSHYPIRFWVPPEIAVFDLSAMQ